jgi:SAM-dependent methyltransferase
MNSDTAKLTPMESWDVKAGEWAIQVGDEGDMNRRYQSDPVLWRMLGEVAGRTILDAGCGTGYLSIVMARRGARVIGVDWSPRMIDVGRGRAEALGVEVDLRVDSCSELATLPNASVDAIVSNYVLMDLPDLEGAVASFHRVLRDGGQAVVVFSHPCFAPPGGFGRSSDGSTVFRWDRSYFDRFEGTEEWGHFTTPFIFYHRPLSHYWRAFRAEGFRVLDFDEPVIPVPPPPEIDDARLRRFRMVPNSVAFLLEK